MNHQAHLIAGLTSGLIVSGALLNYGSPEIALVGGTACFLGSLFCDLDTKSHASKIMAGSIIAIFIYKWVVSDNFILSVVLAGIFLLAQVSKHRGWTHSYLLPLILSCASIFINDGVVLICFSIGIIVHLTLDSIYPWQFKKWF